MLWTFKECFGVYHVKEVKAGAKDVTLVTGGEAEGVEVVGEDETELLICNTQTIRDILMKEKGDLEAWRCVLPSGTVVRYKQNGDAQVGLLSL